MITHIRVVGWERFQHYKHRKPPWIRLYSKLLDNPNWICLQDASKAHLVSLWLLASQTDNEIPADQAWLKARTGCKRPFDLQTLESLGFIETASKALAKCSAQSSENRVQSTEKTNYVSSRNGRTLSVGFQKFWKLYPARNGKKRGKPDAWKIWQRDKLEQHTEGILKAVRKDIAHRNACSQRNEFCEAPCDPERYLKRKRWNDEIDPRSLT